VRYAEGKGTKRDAKMAAQWFERAGRDGLAPAQYRLAAMYERGLGVDPDPVKARAWYKAAAQNGNVKAMHNLAVSVSGHDGGAPDYTFAAKWYISGTHWPPPQTIPNPPSGRTSVPCS
jgi:localization factor PodJL